METRWKKTYYLLLIWSFKRPDAVELLVEKYFFSLPLCPCSLSIVAFPYTKKNSVSLVCHTRALWEDEQRFATLQNCSFEREKSGNQTMTKAWKQVSKDNKKSHRYWKSGSGLCINFRIRLQKINWSLMLWRKCQRRTSKEPTMK